MLKKLRTASLNSEFTGSYKKNVIKIRLAGKSTIKLAAQWSASSIFICCSWKWRFVSKRSATA